jgi:hypothetical protein
MTDKGVNDFKILAVPASDPTFSEFHDLWRVPSHYLREVEHFFATYKQLEEQTVKTMGWEGAEAARYEVMESIKRFQAAENNFGRRAGDKVALAAKTTPETKGKASPAKQTKSPTNKESAAKPAVKPAAEKKPRRKA